MTTPVHGSRIDWNEKTSTAWELACKTFIASADSDEASQALISGFKALPKDQRDVAFVLAPIFKFLRAVQQKNIERNTKIAALEARVAAFEAAPKSLDYHGIWQRAALYCRNEAATHKSVLWVCVAETSRGNEPGNSPDWQLAQKDQAR